VRVWTALDLLRGRAVRLSQGRRETATDYGEALEVLSRWTDQGLTRFHVVDLGGAFGDPPAAAAVVEAAAARWPGARFEVGGGIRSADDARRLAQCGAARVVVGSLLFQDPEEACRIADLLGSERCVAALDVRGGTVRTGGWLDSSGLGLHEAMARAEACGFGEALVTDISRDGDLGGPNVELYRELGEASLPVLASGGVASPADVEALAVLPWVAGAVVGRALYEGRVSPGFLRRFEA
jgi:phosphoribosylformimino-5-aminoimidazole carboxamide ribotide isomerase